MTYWFKAKKYGYGWQPARWQGWLVLLAFIALVGWNAYRFSGNGEPAQGQIVWFAISNVILIVLLLLICVRTGEKPRWQWGNKKKWKSANDELNKDL